MADLGGLPAGQNCEQVIKYRYRTHPAILANIPLNGPSCTGRSSCLEESPSRFVGGGQFRAASGRDSGGGAGRILEANGGIRAGLHRLLDIDGSANGVRGPAISNAQVRLSQPLTDGQVSCVNQYDEFSERMSELPDSTPALENSRLMAHDGCLATEQEGQLDGQRLVSAENRIQELMERLDCFIEQYLSEGDKLNLWYYLNEFETNNCDLSDLLANLMQNLLIKLPNAFIKYKLLDYIKQIYLQPTQPSSPDKAADNDDFDDNDSMDGLANGLLPIDWANGTKAPAAATTIVGDHLHSNKHQVDLRLFEAMQWRYLLASNALMRSSLDRAVFSSTELQKKRRRKRRAAELQLLRGLRVKSSSNQVKCCPFKDSFGPSRTQPNLATSNAATNGELPNEAACQLLSGWSSSASLSNGIQACGQQQLRRRGVRNLGKLDPNEWPSAVSMIDWSRGAGKRRHSSSNIPLIDYHSKQFSGERARTADNSHLHLHLYLNQNEREREENSSSSSNSGKINESGLITAKLDYSKPRGRFDLWPGSLSPGDRKFSSQQKQQQPPDVPDSADERLFGRNNGHRRDINKRRGLAQLMQPVVGARFQVLASSQNHYLPLAAATTTTNAMSASLDSLSGPKQAFHKLWGRNEAGYLSTEVSTAHARANFERSLYLEQEPPPGWQVGAQTMAFGKLPPPPYDDLALLDRRKPADYPLEFEEDDLVRPSSCLGAELRLPSPSSSSSSDFGFGHGHRRHRQHRQTATAARRASSYERPLGHPEQSVAVWPGAPNPTRPIPINNGLPHRGGINPRSNGEHHFIAMSGAAHYCYETRPQSTSHLEQAQFLATTARNAMELPSVNNCQLEDPQMAATRAVHRDLDELDIGGGSHRLTNGDWRGRPTSGLLQPPDNSPRGAYCCSSSAATAARSIQAPLDFNISPQTSSIQQTGWLLQSNWHANCPSGNAILPTVQAGCTSGQSWHHEAPLSRSEVGGQCLGSPTLLQANYNDHQAALIPLNHDSRLGQGWVQQQVGSFQKPAPPPPPPPCVNQIGHDKLAPFSGASSTDPGARFLAHEQPQTTCWETAKADCPSQTRRRRHKQQTGALPASSLERLHHNQPHHLEAAGLWGPNEAWRTASSLNQLKDNPVQPCHCCRRLQPDQFAGSGRQHSRAEPDYPVNNFHHDDYGQYNCENENEPEQGMTAVPVQARGRLSMSVAEQMKEQASAFVQNYNADGSQRSGQRSKARQKPNLQVRRKLRVRIKKSKPILGIAIEGGFNVSGQLLPRIVCVHIAHP